MKKLTLLYCAILCVISLLFVALMHIQVQAVQTQQDLNNDACNSYKKADQELNSVYQQIQHEYSNDKVFLAALTKAQLAWIAFRDAEEEALFPKRIVGSYSYGRVEPMCRCFTREKITAQRVKELKVWLEGAEEGDVCRGSIRINSSRVRQLELF
jgi:uncharacterized protein YecT (DUF1311 family)